MGENDWDRVLDINLKGAFNCTKAVSRGMFRNRYGRIINITSTAGEVGNPGQANYSASKAGIIGLTKSTAKEFSSRGITVNAVSPGFVETEIIADLNEDMRKKYLEAIPLGRFGRVEDISSAVCFLVSKSASYITGEVIKVNGGIYM
jgi:3-oxoacyl-[acyl-carrier protein] reductase